MSQRTKQELFCITGLNGLETYQTLTKGSLKYFPMNCWPVAKIEVNKEEKQEEKKEVKEKKYKGFNL